MRLYMLSVRIYYTALHTTLFPQITSCFVLFFFFFHLERKFHILKIVYNHVTILRPKKVFNINKLSARLN